MPKLHQSSLAFKVIRNRCRKNNFELMFSMEVAISLRAAYTLVGFTQLLLNVGNDCCQILMLTDAIRYDPEDREGVLMRCIEERFLLQNNLFLRFQERMASELRCINARNRAHVQASDAFAAFNRSRLLDEFWQFSGALRIEFALPRGRGGFVIRHFFLLLRLLKLRVDLLAPDSFLFQFGLGEFALGR